MKIVWKIVFKLLFIFLIIGILALYLYKKTSPQQLSSTPPATYPEISIAVPPKSVYDLITDLIIEKKYDLQAGFQLKKQYYDSQESILSLLSKQVDVANIPVVEVSRLNEEGNNIAIFGPSLKLICPIVVSETSPIQSFEELKNKRLGILSKTSGTYISLEIGLLDQGSSIDKYFSSVVTGGMPALSPMLVKNEVDVVTGNTCNVVSMAKLAIQLKARPVGSVESLLAKTASEGANLLLVGFAARKDWLENNQALAVNLNKAYRLAQEDLQQNRDYLNQPETIKKYEFTPEEIAYIDAYVVQNNYFSFKPWKEVIADNMKLLEKAKEYGLIKGSNLSDVFVDYQQ